ncbi:MAG: hypothetical protein FWC67_00340 [Defluviitaleaceae bacterium]|nr:hypothetical protein [Defluviitaleaceae bacterium]
MKRMILAGVLAAAGLFVLAACGAIQERVDGNVYEKIHRQLLAMEGFTAQATVTYISNNNQHAYETVQHARADGRYRIEVTAPANVAGNTTVFDGTTISQFNPRLDGRVAQTTSEAPERVEILLTTFVRNFVRSQETSVMASMVDESLTTVLEAPIPGEHPYLAMARLWVNNDTLLPVQMVIFDAAGGERVIIVYNTFEFDPEMPDETFHAPQ